MTDARPTADGDAADSAADGPRDLPDGDALHELVDEGGVVLAELYTANCGICASMEPVLGIVARATDATVATVNAGEDLDLADEFRVRRVPTLLLFVDGDLRDRKDEGFYDAETLVEWVEDVEA